MCGRVLSCWWVREICGLCERTAKVVVFVRVSFVYRPVKVKKEGFGTSSGAVEVRSGTLVVTYLVVSAQSLYVLLAGWLVVWRLRVQGLWMFFG